MIALTVVAIVLAGVFAFLLFWGIGGPQPWRRRYWPTRFWALGLAALAMALSLTAAQIADAIK